MRFKAKFLNQSKTDTEPSGIGSLQDHSPSCAGCARCDGQPPVDEVVYLKEV